MMIDINFLQNDKHRNSVPFLIGVLFFLFVTSISFLLYLQYTSFVQQQQALEQQLGDAVQTQLESKDENERQIMRMQLSQQINQLESEVFPSLALMDRLVALLPMDGYFENYSFDITSGISLVVRITTLEQVAAFTHALEQENYITNVDLSTIQQTGTINGKSIYTASFMIAIDNDSWMKEAK